MVVERWATGSEDDFATVYPFREGRDARLNAAKSQFVRKEGLRNVLRVEQGRAVLALSGVQLGFNSGDDTISGRGFSGIYEARLQEGRWKLTARVPLEELGTLLSHQMQVSIQPGFGLTVEDRMRVEAKGRDGFAGRLNHAAKLDTVTVNGRAVSHLFSGGLLWVDVPKGSAEVTVKYSIEVEEGPNDTNSGCFLRKAGHVRNQYFWHPFFDFNSAGDRADFDIEVHIPGDYRISTSIPQTERVEGGERIVHGKSIRKGFALTLVYDRDWRVMSERFGGIQLELFLTPAFMPNAESIVGEFRSVYEFLAQRFGAPPGGYFGVVEERSETGNGWHFASNQIVVASGWPRVMSASDNRPRAHLGHEISHLWTQGAGPASNFLQEGWATYAESLILEREFGAALAKTFWKSEAADYLRQFDGKASLLEDENNGGVAYSKGAWVFHMLEEAMGGEAFSKAMEEYSRRSLTEPAGWEILADCAQKYAPADFDTRSFLTPWLTEKNAPRLTTQTNGRVVTLRQDAPYFTLPVTIEASTGQGMERQRVWIRGAEAAVTFSSDVVDTRIDPDALLLLRR